MTGPEFNQFSATASSPATAEDTIPGDESREIDFLRTSNQMLVLLTMEERAKARELQSRLDLLQIEHAVFVELELEVIRTVFAGHLADLKAEEVTRVKAKQETAEKVGEMVKKQSALTEETEVAGHSKFSDLGVDSPDSVEIVMGLEESFGIGEIRGREDVRE